MDETLAEKIYTHKKNTLVSEAFVFAAQAHAEEFRKGTEIPYIVHPAEAAAIAAGLLLEKSLADRLEGDPNEVIAAAVLHDTLEDTATTDEDLIITFGENVAKLVLQESENRRFGQPIQDGWEIRKQETIERIANTDDIRVKIVCFSDKLANLRAIYRDYCNLGDKLLERFNQHDPQKHAWYYRSILESCPELKDTAAYEEYEALLAKGFF